MPTTQRRARAVTMNAPLQRKYQAIRALLRTADRDEARTRHRMGRLILSVRKAEHKYGERAVARLAGALGRDEATLYRYAQVAERWSAAELGLLLHREDCHGFPLSWSHLVELSAIVDAERRAAFIARSLEQGWSVRVLAKAIEGTAEADVDETAQLRRFVTTSEALRSRANWEAADLEAEPSHALLSLVERAVAAQSDLHEICERNLERLRAVRERFTRELARRVPTAPASAPRAPLSGTRLATATGL